MSILSSRYTGSAETQFDVDIRAVASRDFEEVLRSTEEIALSSAFWTAGLAEHLDTSGTTSPYFWVWVAAQVKANDTGFLSRDITVRELVTHLGDIHHIYPKELLKSAGLHRGQYNQIANYAYTQEEINIKIGKKAPNTYMSDVKGQCSGGKLKYGSISDNAFLKKNLAANSIPEDLSETDVADYESFLKKRRVLMAEKMREYYASL
jgi:hypothetical protein